MVSNAAMMGEPNPDSVAKTYNNATESGVPFSTADIDSDAFNKEVETRKRQEALKFSDPLSGWVMQAPENPKLAWDDMPKLSEIGEKAERAFKHGSREEE